LHPEEIGLDGNRIKSDKDKETAVLHPEESGLDGNSTKIDADEESACVFYIQRRLAWMAIGLN
jgi:hypothetical protein